MILIAYITIDSTEEIERAIKRFKRLVEKEGIIREWKKREYFVKPSSVNHRKKQAMQRKLQNKNRKTNSIKY